MTTKKLGAQISQKLGVNGKGVFLYLNPEMWPYTRRHVANSHREEHAIKPEEIELRCVDIGDHRLYAVFFKPQHMRAVMLSWGTPGLGLSIRIAEALLKSGMDSLREVPFESFEQPPPPSWTPETSAHKDLKERISSLMHRAAIDPSKVTCKPEDVYLYPSGMGAVFHTTNLLAKYRPATSVVLGVVFHNTALHLSEESPHGYKLFGDVSDRGIDELEAWLQDEEKNNRKASFLYTEIPGNPNVETPHLHRVKELSEKYGFVFVVDDTVASVANVDVLPQSDLVLTSLTKSFNGQANAMGGSVILNPLSAHYTALASLFKSTFHNEYFAGDAEVVLAQSHDLLERTQRLNHNGQAMAEFLHGVMQEPDSPVANVQYPTLLESKVKYDRYLRRATPELPKPGYGCLLSVDFKSVEIATAFYDRCSFYPSPHLGAHVTIQFAYNMMMFGKKDEETEAMRKFGVNEEGIRISAGLEEEQDLIDTLRDGLEAAKKAQIDRGN